MWFYEDDDVIVVNKPRGMVVHPAVGHSDGTLVNALMHHCGENLSKIGGERRPGIVHRIDKDTLRAHYCRENDFSHISLSKTAEGQEPFRGFIEGRCYVGMSA